MTNLLDTLFLLLSLCFIFTDAQFWSGGWNAFNNFTPRNTGWLQARRRNFFTDDDDDDSWGIRQWGRRQRLPERRRSIWSNDDSDDDSWRSGQRMFRFGDDDDGRWRRFRSEDNDDNRWRRVNRQRRNFWDDSDDEDDNRSRFRFRRQNVVRSNPRSRFRGTQRNGGNNLCNYYIRTANILGIQMYCS